MNREIKFRIWDNVNKYFIHSWWVQFGEDRIRLITDVGCYLDILHVSIQDKNNYTIQQYIGLKDKNEKEIYEGDVVKDKFDTKTVTWNAIHVYPFSYYGGGEMGNSDCEVIGNIFETPNLIQK